MALAICYSKGGYNVVNTNKVNPWFRWNKPVSELMILEYSQDNESRENRGNIAARLGRARAYGCESMPLSELLGKDYDRLVNRYLSNISG